MGKSQDQHRKAHEELVKAQRAKFQTNRITYVTPNGIHTVYDIKDVNGLADQLRADGFEARCTTQSEEFMTTDWFKHGEGDWWESYVITKK
jgi:uncharacterized lipoprotein